MEVSRVDLNNLEEIEVAINLLQWRKTSLLEDDALKRQHLKAPAPISDLLLSARPHNILMAEGIDTIDKLTSCREWELMKMPNMGKKSIKEIKGCLASWGLHLYER